MSKYSFVGVISIVVGFLEIALFTFWAIQMPRLINLYKEFDASFNEAGTYTALVVLSFVGVALIFVGRRLFSKNEEIRKKTLRPALGLIALSFFAGGLFWVILVLGLVLPIYNLTSQF